MGNYKSAIIASVLLITAGTLMVILTFGQDPSLEYLGSTFVVIGILGVINALLFKKEIKKEKQ